MAEKEKEQEEQRAAQEKYECTICSREISDPKNGYIPRYDFKLHIYTDEPICDGCECDQDDYMGDYLSGDDW